MGETGPHRGFEHMELANHFGMRHSHYDLWLAENHPDIDARRYRAVTDKGQQNMAANGDTGAVQVWPTDIPKELYHTDWVAQRTMAWLDT